MNRPRYAHTMRIKEAKALKRQLKLIIALMLVAIVLTGCSSNTTPTPTAKPTVNATFTAGPTMMGSPTATNANASENVMMAVKAVAGVADATAVVLNNKALVGVALVSGTTLDNDIKDDIVTAAKTANSALTVYVTADATIYNEIKTLASDMATMTSEKVDETFNTIMGKLGGGAASPAGASASPMASPMTSATAK